MVGSTGDRFIQFSSKRQTCTSRATYTGKHLQGTPLQHLRMKGLLITTFDTRYQTIFDYTIFHRIFNCIVHANNNSFT